MTNLEQVTWDDLAGDTEEDPEPTVPGPEPESAGGDGRPLDPESGCPWCLAPPEMLTENENGEISCDLCMAVQPTTAEWYQDGDKIVDVKGASQMYQQRWEAVRA